MREYSVRISAFAFCLAAGSLVAIVGLSRAFSEPQLLTNQAQTLEEQSSDSKEAVGEIWAGEILGDAELAYHGYVVQMGFRNAKLDYPPEASERPHLVEISYAILKRRGRVLARFDADIYSRLGNATRFRLFSFLGGDEKQLFVSQDVPRGGNQWIVSLSTQVRVIYDGTEYKTGREGDDMSIIDLDKDGVYEIIQPITAFYSFHNLMAMSEIPLPAVIFKYDKKAKKYLPANRTFQDYLLKDIDEAKRKAAGPEDQFNHPGDVIEIVLDYIFAGKEPEAWAFYEETYKLPEKAIIKERIKKALREQPVYRFLYRKTHLAREK